jgi:hypothetical protein
LPFSLSLAWESAQLAAVIHHLVQVRHQAQAPMEAGNKKQFLVINQSL